MKPKTGISLLLSFISLLSCDNQNLVQPTVVLISIDGFRHDYAEKYQATNLLDIANEGVQASSLIPCFPSKTFPNHYSIITGMYPENHGILDNYFYDQSRKEYYQGSKVQDGSWYGGTPLWVLASQQGMKSASFLWLGSEAEIKKTRPTYYKNWLQDQNTSGGDIVTKIIDWLKLPKDKRPQFISAYFSLVDQAGHDFGVDSQELTKAVQKMDQYIGKLRNELSQLKIPVDLIIISDHGMSNIDNTTPIYYKDMFDFNSIDHVYRDTYLMVYSTDSMTIDELYQTIKSNENGQYTAYNKDEIPNSFHFQNNDRIGNLLIVANPPYIFSSKDVSNGKGTHGYDPKNEDMHGVFYAIGPNIKKGMTVNSFENIHIYPLIADLLNLSYDTTSIDGKYDILQKIISE